MNLFAPIEVREIELRDYQIDAVERLRAGIRAGHRRQILVAPTAFGKTECAAHIIKQSQEKGATAWFIVDRISLIDQTSDRFGSYGIDHGIIQADHPLTASWKPVQIASAQTLARRRNDKLPDLIVVDEAHCFPSGTAIATPSGAVAIENIKVGDAVFNAIGVGYVLHTFLNPATTPMARVEFDDGSSVRCTANHRFLTADAWYEAQFLDGKSVFGVEDMPGLWEAISASYTPHEAGQLASRVGSQLAQADLLLSELREEAEEPNGQPSVPQKDDPEIGGNRSQAKRSGRQRSWDDRAAASIIAETWRRLDSGICGENGTRSSRRISSSLQSRPGESRSDGGDRDRRQHALGGFSDGAGFQKGRVVVGKRVVRVEVEERRSAEHVYNINVSGHPSYFAGGALVHNCEYKSTLELIARAERAKVIGLTATPFTAGMAEHWDGLVNGATVNNLLARKYLAPLKIKACVAPDMTGAKKKFTGEYEDEEAGARGVTIIGDVVKTWVEQTAKFFGGPVKTIVFSPSVKHGAELCRHFAEAGYNFQQISYLDKDDGERREKIAEFRRPDSAIHGLVSCAVLTKGFDVPDVRCGISCRPYRKSFSSHIQEMGRVMRISPGKEFGLWLDHSGNCISFADDTAWLFEYGVDSLSDAQKRDSTVREPGEQITRKRFCGSCGLQMETGSDVCPSCGWQRPQHGEIQIVQGELIDLEISTKEAFQPRHGLRADCLKNPRAVWNAAVAYCNANSRRGPEAARKWAFGIWAGIYPGAKLPRGLYDGPCDPGKVKPEEYGLIEREIARFRKTPRRAA